MDHDEVIQVVLGHCCSHWYPAGLGIWNEMTGQMGYRGNRGIQLDTKIIFWRASALISYFHMFNTAYFQLKLLMQ